MGRGRNHLYAVLALACLLGAVRFVMRGPMKSFSDPSGHTNSHDLGTIYASSRAWRMGLNPYDHAVMAKIWADAGGPMDRVPTRQDTPSVYPITTFLCLSPLAEFSWPTARLIWCAINIAAMAVLLEVVRRLAKFKWHDPRMLILTAVTLALRPFSSAVALGQLSLVVTAMGAMTLLATSEGCGTRMALLNAIGVALKAPLAAAFVVPDLLARRWKALVISGVVLIALCALAYARMEPPAKWAPDWFENLRSASDAGGVNDASIANHHRHELLNLQYPLSTSISNRIVVDAIVWILAAALVWPALVRLGRRPGGAAVLLPISVVCLVEVFSFYHRVYDATVLIFPLAWALLRTTPRWQSWPVFLLLIVFLAPGRRRWRKGRMFQTGSAGCGIT